jgi:hypothetical protein
MRFTVHGEQNIRHAEIAHDSATDAIIGALALLGTGMSVVYIYDDATDQTFWPDDFDALYAASTSEANARLSERAPSVR